MRRIVDVLPGVACADWNPRLHLIVVLWVFLNSTTCSLKSIAKQNTNFSCLHLNLVWTRLLILHRKDPWLDGWMDGWIDDLAEKSIGHS
jgi:hypothetical protein